MTDFSTLKHKWQDLVEGQPIHPGFVAVGLLGLLIRIGLAPWWMHVDPHFGGDAIILSQMALDFVRGGHPANVYPPLALLTIGSFESIWLAPAKLTWLTGVALVQAIPAASLFRTLFALKSLYLLFDLVGAVWLVKTCKPEQRHVAWLFWLLNPLVIYNAYVHGQYDVMPVSLVVVSLFFAKTGKWRWAAFWLGIAGCYKNFPFFFLLPLLMIAIKPFREKVYLLGLATLPYLLLMFPFWGQYQAGVNNYPNQFFRVAYDLGLGAQVYLFFVFYAALLWYLYQRRAHTFEDLWRACFAILLVYFQFSYFDLHYWAWLVPFAVLFWVEYPREAKPFYLVIGLCLLALLAPTPVARYLAPISPRFFLRLPSLLEALNPYLPMLLIVNIVRSLLAGTCFYLAWRLVRGLPAARQTESLPVPVVPA